MQLFKAAVRLSCTAYVFVGLGIRLFRSRTFKPALVREAFERMGGTYIKIGQFVASTPSLFPRAFADEFQKCLDNVPSLPFPIIERVLQKELGRPIADCFAEIDRKPLAAASIAQVHAARLPSGTSVVIKVQRPGISTILRTDLWFLTAVARIVQLFFPLARAASVGGISTEMRRTFLEECDFLLEAGRMKSFAQFLKDSSVKIVTVPIVHDQLTTKKILVMERLYGQSLTDIDQLRHAKVDPTMCLSLSLNVWLMSVAQCDFFHADVHGGNLLLLDDGRIGFIDFGVVGSVDEQSWPAVLAFVDALTRRNYREVAQTLIELGATSEAAETEALGNDLTVAFRRLDTANSGRLVDRDQAGQLLADLASICQKHGLHLPREFFLLLRQYLYFDRFLRAVAPTVIPRM